MLLGAPPPPPPANVSQIAEDKNKKQEAQTFREKLTQHAENAACAACHRKMDPLGFALDNYNAVGLWRDKHGDQPLDVSGELPTGEKLHGASDLKRVLVARKSEFIRNLTEQMLTYALGRELDYYDDCPVQQIGAELQKDDYPVILAGGASTGLRAGRHLAFEKKAPMANLYVELLNLLGVPTTSFGESHTSRFAGDLNGRLPGLV